MSPTNLTGRTQVFAVLGHPVAHTLSPAMHNRSFAALGLDAVYVAFDVAPESLVAVLPAMRDLGFRGVNLTVPLKEVAFRGLASLDESARRLGAVNTVEFRGGDLVGHNTDGHGFLAAVREAFGTEVRDLAPVFVLGCGGAGRAVAIACAAEGAAELTLTDLDESRPERLAAELRALAPSLRIQCVPPVPAAWARACRRARLAVHCTPVGMKAADASLLPPEAFAKGQLAFDLIYMYPETPFMRAAREGGARTANGLGMLLHQGARSFEIWTGRPADTAAMRAALEEAVYPPAPARGAGT